MRLPCAEHERRLPFLLADVSDCRRREVADWANGLYWSWRGLGKKFPGRRYHDSSVAGSGRESVLDEFYDYLGVCAFFVNVSAGVQERRERLFHLIEFHFSWHLPSLDFA